MILFIRCPQGLGKEFKKVVVTICQREHPITFEELFDTLIEHENFLNSDESNLISHVLHQMLFVITPNLQIIRPITATMNIDGSQRTPTIVPIIIVAL